MQEENSKESDVKGTIGAVADLIKAVPVYQDTLQPAAKQVGKSLELVSKTVNIALAPIKVLVWGYEQIEEFIIRRVSEKLEKIPPENILTPLPQIAGPAIEALRYAGHDRNLRELYANLLATAMDKETISKAHPAYVDIIKNMTSDEAILLSIFLNTDSIPLIDIREKFNEEVVSFRIIYSNFSHIGELVTIDNPDLIPSYLDNLCRLGILEIPPTVYLSAANTYEPLQDDPALNSIKETITGKSKGEVEFVKKFVTLTDFGRHFIENVVKEK